MEDAYIGKWFGEAQAAAAGRVPGTFHITLPIRVPDGANAREFAEALVETIQQNAPDSKPVMGQRLEDLDADVRGVS